MKAETRQLINDSVDKALERSLDKYWHSRMRKEYDACIEFKIAFKEILQELTSEV